MTSDPVRLLAWPVLLQPLRRVVHLDLIHLGRKDEVRERQAANCVGAQVHSNVPIRCDVHIGMVPFTLSQCADLLGTLGLRRHWLQSVNALATPFCAQIM